MAKRLRFLIEVKIDLPEDVTVTDVFEDVIGGACDAVEAERVKIEDVRIDDLELSVRTARVLREQKIETIGDLESWTARELLRLPSFGRKSLNELLEVLEGKGLPVQCGHDPIIRT